jgi:HD-GYP domain-containing protein (c-di-GMP phosphodiesterase class II)
VSTAVLLAAFGQHLGMNEDDLVEVGLGGLLMDIGKVRIPPGILGKPGKLNAQELALMHRHVEYGREILKDTPDIPPIAMDIVTDHHERLDGSGYPDGKAGDDISFYGMMAAIVDFYDAISTRRVYLSGSG